MKRIDDKVLKEIIERIEELERLLTERVMDFHEVKGMMQARHAYIYYRKLVWDIKYLLRDNIKNEKD